MRAAIVFQVATILLLGACSSGGLAGVRTTGTSSGTTTSGGTTTSSGAGLNDAGFPFITVDGGVLAELNFAVVGDTRPESVGDTANYPSQTINTIFTDLKMVTPAPQFVVGTGDYQYVNPGSGQSVPQITKYMAAAALYPAALLPAMGNHECTGYTDSECGPNGQDGMTENYNTYLSMMAAPLGATTPYYSVLLTAADGSWTAKVVCVAPNAWDSEQSAWLASVLAQPSTYTFYVQHEPMEDTTELSQLTEIAAVVNAAPTPPTLMLVGHSHTFRKSYSIFNEVVVGNGGVPMTTGGFGFALITRESSGDIQLTQYDETTGAPTPNGVSFSVTASGSPGS